MRAWRSVLVAGPFVGAAILIGLLSALVSTAR
jgi:hypothetical protein